MGTEPLFGRPEEREEQLGRMRRLGGQLAAPTAFAIVWALPLPTLSVEAHRLAAVSAAVIVLWVTEALPMPLTALIGASACVVLQVAPIKDVFLSFADPLIFLFIGAFILARGLFMHRLDRRLAYGILTIPWVGARPGRILFAFGCVTALISAFVANMATTMMMYAVAMSILGFMFDPKREGGPLVPRSYATCLMLMTTFAASVGGLATPVGAAPNLIGIGIIRKTLNIEVSFLKWCMIGVPGVLALFAYLTLYLGFLGRTGRKEVEGGREMLLAERDSVGPWTKGQVSVVIGCLLTVSLWLLPGLLGIFAGEKSAVFLWLQKSIPEPIAALLGAILLFMLPGDREGRAMTWEEAAKIDWGIILLFGGGMTLGLLAFQTGLAKAVGTGLAGIVPSGSPLAMLAFSVVTALLVSEITSNTASVGIVVPIVIAIAQANGVDPVEPALGATFGSGLGFMLPVSTPCNAVVYGSGYVPLRYMIAYGFLLDVVGALIIIATIGFIFPLVR